MTTDPMPGSAEWYKELSKSRGLSSPQCPYAKAERCQRYCASWKAINDRLPHYQHFGPSDIECKEWEDYWIRKDPLGTPSTMRPFVFETARSKKDPDTWNQFCPEVVFECEEIFASSINYDLETENLVDNEKFRYDEIRLRIRDFEACHYSDCPDYSRNQNPEMVKMDPSPGSDEDASYGERMRGHLSGARAKKSQDTKERYRKLAQLFVKKMEGRSKSYRTQACKEVAKDYSKGESSVEYKTVERAAKAAEVWEIDK